MKFSASPGKSATAETYDLRVSGMDCASCAATIESALLQVEGVSDVRVDVVGGKVRVGYNGGETVRRDLSAAVQRVGYRVEAPQDDRLVAPAESFWKRRGRSLATLLSGLALGAGLLLGGLEAPRELVLALLAVSGIAGGWYVVPRGVRAAMNRALDMNFLMSIAAVGAWIIGEQTEAAATLFLFAIAELLEAHSMDRARNAIKALMDLSPAEASVLRNGQEIRVPATQIDIGETVVVRPGEKVPIDGDVTSGRSGVNQASITGESMPVDKDPGMTVFAGSLNGQGVLNVRSTKLSNDTTLARIIHAVEEAQASRAPSQTFVDRFARIYTPIVVGLAILVAIGPPLLGGGEWETWIYRALTMLVVACPCALVISTPVSIVSGLTGAARRGILIKGGAHLENAAAITTVCFDKTGTLTRGRPSLTNVVPLDGQEEYGVIRLALGVERYSEHPLALAVLEYGRALDISSPPSSDFEGLIGKGARATIEGKTVYVGNERLAYELGLTNEHATAALERFQLEGKTAVLVATSREIMAVLAISDQVRPEARGALDALKAFGIRRTIMLTGDNDVTARTVAGQLGIDEYRAGLLPDDKVRIVQELEANGERVAFIGDGVNDAPALAAATLGVAMGAAGTDVALETADMALMGDDLTKLALAMRLSRETLVVIQQNVWFSIAIKAIFLVLAVGGWATLWMAVAADMGASLLVVLNGLRPLRVRA